MKKKNTQKFVLFFIPKIEEVTKIYKPVFS